MGLFCVSNARNALDNKYSLDFPPRFWGGCKASIRGIVWNLGFATGLSLVTGPREPIAGCFVSTTIM